MSRSADDDGFRPHPGDPWHPGWSSEGEGAPEAEPGAVADEAVSAASAPSRPLHRRFGLGRRRARREADAGPEPAEEEPAPHEAEDADLSGWWATETAVDETAWEEGPAAPASGLAEEEEPEESPSGPLFPWWSAAAPAAPPAGAPEPPPFVPPPGPEAAPRREEAGAASVIPLDLPAGPPVPSPSAPGRFEAEPPERWEEEAAAAPLGVVPPRPAAPPPAKEPEAGKGPSPLLEPAAAPEAASVADELALATAALLAELGEEPTVEPLAAEAEEAEEDWEGSAEAPLPAAGPVPELDLPGGDEGQAPLPLGAAGVPEDGLSRHLQQPEAPAGPGEADLGAEPAGLVLAAWEPRREESLAEPAVPPSGEARAAGTEATPVAAAPVAAGWPAPAPAEGAEVLPAELAGEAEVGEWLAFVEGLPAGTVPPAVRPGPAAESPEVPEAAGVEIEAEEWPPAVSGERRRGWLRRRRRGGKRAEEALTPDAGETVEVAGAEAVVRGEEAHQPPPWSPVVPSDLTPPEPGEMGAELDEEAEAEAAWRAWESEETAADTAPAPVAPSRPVAPPPGARPPVAAGLVFGAAAPEQGIELEAEPAWEEAEWSGELERAAAGWEGEVDEDEVAVPPAALPEEEWEEEGLAPAPPGREERPGAVRRETLGDTIPAPEADVEEEEAGWEVFPVRGEPLPPGTDMARQTGRLGPVMPGAAPEEPPEAAGWERFPEPGTRPAGRQAAAARRGPVPGPEPVFPEGEEETAAEWPEAEYPEAVRPVAGEPVLPRRGAAVDEPTLEILPPVAYDFESPARRQGPISEELVAGAATMEHRGLAEEIAAADTAETELQALSAPMLGLESGVVGFEDVAHLGYEEEAATPVRSDLPMRVATGMVLLALLLGSLWVGGEFLAGFVGLMLILGLGEFYGTLRRRGHQPLALFGFLGAMGLLAGSWFYGPVAIPVAVVAATILSFFYYAFAPHRRDALTNGALTILGMLWVAGTGAFAFPIAKSPSFRVLVLALAATVIATDVGAFFAGRAWGARPMAPVLSPRKTWEGLAGGVVLGIAMAVGAGFYFDEIGIRAGAALGLVVAVMAPLGDLAESMVKRSLGVKDMGSMLPGHGGILDRIDAFLFVLPAAWVLFETMGLLR